MKTSNVRPFMLGVLIAIAVQPFAVGGTDLLEDGRLDQWYTWIKGRGRDQDPKHVFSVADGVLRISGEEWGCLTSRREYGDYHLLIEYRWGTKTFAPREANARDSGVLIHSVGRDGGYNGTWMHSLEVQLIEGGTGDLLVVGDGSSSYRLTCPVAPEKQGGSYLFRPDGDLATITAGRINWYGRDPQWADVKGFRGKNDVEKPIGQWNRLEVIADGGKITVLLNGIVVNRAADCRPRKGRLQIQSEGAELFIRKIRLAPLAAAAQAKPDDRRRRFIYNTDGDNMFIYKDYPMSVEDVYRYVDEIADAGVTTLHASCHVGMDVNFQGETADLLGSHPTAAEADRLKDLRKTRPKSLERAVANFRGLIQAGHDPFGLVIQRARARGLEVLVSFRLNEVHGVDKPPNMLLSKFWLAHPEWHVGKLGDPVPQRYLDILGPHTSPIVASWLPGGLDFSVPQVRERKLAQLREICQRYPIDGIELDFQRFPVYFPFGREGEGIEVMNGWLREVRAMTRQAGKQRGRPLLLTARIMATPSRNRAIGLDPVTWAKEGLLDSVIISHYLHNDFPLPVKEYRALLPESLPLYASIEVEQDADRYRAIARQLWRDGVDGIMMFNFFTCRERGVEPDFGVLADLGAPAPPRSDRPMLLVANKHSDTLSYIDPAALEVEQTITVGPNPHELVITPDQRTMYLSNYAPPGNTISVVDLVRRRHIKQIPTGKYTRIHGAAMAPDGKNAYFTAGQTGWVVEVDTATHRVTRAIPTQGKISHMVLVSPDNRRIYTANIVSENVSVIDRKSGQLITQIPCERGAEGMAFTPDGKQLWVANQTGGSMTIIDLATHRVVGRFDLPGMPVRIRFTRDGKRAYVPSWTPVGELIVIDVPSRTEIKRVKVGGYAIGVELSPDEKRAFVGCEYRDGLHVVNTETLEVEATIATGDGPDPISMWFPPGERGPSGDNTE